MLDGFPRNAEQARAMMDLKVVPHIVLVIELADEKALLRITGRRTDPVTNNVDNPFLFLLLFTGVPHCLQSPKRP